MVLFEICFIVIGDDGDMFDIIFFSSVIFIEILDSNGDVILFNSLFGMIMIFVV